MLPMPLRWMDRTALIRLQVCAFGVKSANRDERLSRLTLKGVEKVMVVASSFYSKQFKSLFINDATTQSVSIINSSKP